MKSKPNQAFLLIIYLTLLKATTRRRFNWLIATTSNFDLHQNGKQAEILFDGILTPMPIRTRLFTLALLFVTAMALNIFALVYLTRAVSNSLGVIERVRERQLTASQMDAHLRDAEAALVVAEK